MGGIGSGQEQHYGAKDTTEDFRAIDVRRWKRDGLLAPYQAFGWQWSSHSEVVASIRVQTETDRVLLTYRHRSGGSNWKDEQYPIYLNWTDCNLGGKRPWFLCPANNCRKRVAKLYGGAIFACRQCHQLAYPSQRVLYYDRTARKAEQIRAKLDWEPGILNGSGLKPKGMHWATFKRLSAKHDALVQISISGMVAHMGFLDESLKEWLEFS